MRVEGVFPAITTPFSASGGVDVSGLKKHLEWLADAGIHGFVPVGTTGEASVLEREERNQVISTALEVAKARGLKTIVGCGGNNTVAVSQLITEAAEMGGDAALVVTPYYNKPTQRGLLAHYKYLADRAEIPIVLYNVPGRTSVSLAVETTLELFQHPKVVGIKEASGQYANWLALSRGEKPLLAGDDDAFAAILSLGGTGIISASANVAPHQFVQIYEHAQSGSWAEAFAVQKRLLPLIQALFRETSPSPAKWALNALGFFEPTVRLPLVEITPATAEALSKAMRDLELLS